jgi:hypothetical protein
MCHVTGNSNRERITKEQFIKSGKELLKMFEENAQHKYYFKLFASGKDHLSKEGSRVILEFVFCILL